MPSAAIVLLLLIRPDVCTSVYTSLNNISYDVKDILCDTRCLGECNITLNTKKEKMPNETPNFNSISILNKLYSADVVDNEFTTDNGQKRTYSSLELEI